MGMFFNVSLVIVGIIGLDSFLKNISKPRLLVLILTPIFYLSLILLSISNFPEKDFINPIFKVILIFSLYLATIFLFKNKTNYLKSFLLLFLIFDLFLEHNATINDRKVLEKSFQAQGKSYFDEDKVIVEHINSVDTSFLDLQRNHTLNF
jgi:hypothetical protein